MASSVSVPLDFYTFATLLPFEHDLTANTSVLFPTCIHHSLPPPVYFVLLLCSFLFATACARLIRARCRAPEGVPRTCLDILRATHVVLHYNTTATLTFAKAKSYSHLDDYIRMCGVIYSPLSRVLLFLYFLKVLAILNKLSHIKLVRFSNSSALSGNVLRFVEPSRTKRMNPLLRSSRRPARSPAIGRVAAHRADLHCDALALGGEDAPQLVLQPAPVRAARDEEGVAFQLHVELQQPL